eukprot:4539999-Lingulodinium_polyedra.AAC.1
MSCGPCASSDELCAARSTQPTLRNARSALHNAQFDDQCTSRNATQHAMPNAHRSMQNARCKSERVNNTQYTVSDEQRTMFNAQRAMRSAHLNTTTQEY